MYTYWSYWHWGSNICPRALARGLISSTLTCADVFVDIDYIVSTVYVVKLPLALCNSSYLTESILAQLHEDAKSPYCIINMEFWNFLMVMTYR